MIIIIFLNMLNIMNYQKTYLDKNLNYNLDTSTLIFFYENNIKYFNMLLNNIMYDYNIKKLLDNVTLDMRKYILEYLFKIKLIETYEIKIILMKQIILASMKFNIYNYIYKIYFK